MSDAATATKITPSPASLVLSVPNAQPPLDPVSPPSGVAPPPAQVVPSHVMPAAHWSLVAQLAKQFPVDGSQRNGLHDFGALLPSAGIDWVPSALHVAVTAEQVPDAQRKPDAQSAVVAHDVLHLVVSSQMYGEQERGVTPAVLQVPLPSQNALAVEVPDAHFAGEHTVSGPWAKPMHLV
jgi:hypothetical protein